MKNLTILNAPDDAFNYEFVVVREIDGDLWYWGRYADGFKAEQTALGIGGIVIHNVRIQGYRNGENNE